MRIEHHLAIAIIYKADNFLMQLRGDTSSTPYRKCWGLFGGHIEFGETPEQAVRRELLEEIDYEFSDILKYGIHLELGIECHIFYGEMMFELQDLNLKEGLDLAILTEDDIYKGERYSEKLKQIRPIGNSYRRVLLDFIEAHKTQ